MYPRLTPRLIIINNKFVLQSGLVVHMVRGRTDKLLNATAQVPDQRMAIEGVPRRARLPVRGDYRVAGMLRGTSVLWPRS